MSDLTKFNPELDLTLELNSNLSPEKIWAGWTQPDILKSWFCPKPWKVTECKIDLRAGGEFFTLMQGPEGEVMPNEGCYLEVVENKKLVWTNMMTSGFHPVPADEMGFAFVATLLITKTQSGSTYKAIVCHSDEKGRKTHEEMGFKEGWTMAFKQLEEYYK